MTNIWVTEYGSVPTESGDRISVAHEPAITTQNVTFTTATQSAAFNSATKYVRLVSDGNCHVLFGANPTADTDDERITAETVEWRSVVGGQIMSVIDA